jgi:hypothetical protein
MGGDPVLWIVIQGSGVNTRMLFSRWIAVLALGTAAYAQTPSQPTSANPTPAPKKNSEAEKERSGYDPLLDLPALPNGKMTLVGGTVAKMDPINDRMSLRQFGGGQLNIFFDMRTKILQNGKPAAVKDIQTGHRVYVDTMLNGNKVFARTIRIETGANQGDARGQVVGLDSSRGILSLREEVAPEPFKLRVTPATKVMMNGRPIPASEVQPGALVVVKFAAGGDSSVAREIRVLANPGAKFTFAGRVTFIDLRLRRLAVANQTDNETYDIALNRVSAGELRGLKVGSEAVVKAVFDGKNYEAESVEITPVKQNANEAEQK